LRPFSFSRELIQSWNSASLNKGVFNSLLFKQFEPYESLKKYKLEFKSPAFSTLLDIPADGLQFRHRITTTLKLRLAAADFHACVEIFVSFKSEFQEISYENVGDRKTTC